MQHKNPNLSLILALKNHIFDEANQTGNENVQNFATSLNEFLSSLITQEQGPCDSDSDGTATASLCHDLYSQIGRLTRKIHNSLDDFNKEVSPGIDRLLTNGIPDTSDRIRYVINLTEESANKVISLAEKQIEDIGEQEKNINQIFEVLNTSPSHSSLEQATNQLKINLDNQKNLCTSVRDSAVEILTSQGFQDLSGQVLKKVTTLIQEVELNLVSIVKMFNEEGQDTKPAAKQEAEINQPNLTGPSSAGCSQDEVNDLLASLGF